MKFFTIGYGGRSPDKFLGLLGTYGITVVVDVRLRPDRASMGAYKLAKDPNKGIQGMLGRAGIEYLSLVELGNLFLDFDDWQTKYRILMEKAGDLLIERLLRISKPFCLMCAEKSAELCHRAIIADYLVKNGWEVEHIE
jgi:uncharacterized protein (DUF488 family)